MRNVFLSQHPGGASQVSGRKSRCEVITQQVVEVDRCVDALCGFSGVVYSFSDDIPFFCRPGLAALFSQHRHTYLHIRAKCWKIVIFHFNCLVTPAEPLLE